MSRTTRCLLIPDPDWTPTPPATESRKPTLLQPGHPDNFQTPASALDPLWEHIPDMSARGDAYTVWEPACGKGNLVKAIRGRGLNCITTDIERGQDFLTWDPSAWNERWDAIITNPPYSIKDAWLARCYELGKPFALLLPLTALEGQKRQALYRRHGLQVILMPKRVNFQTPNDRGSSAWFATGWFCGFMGLPSDLLFWEPPAEPDGLFAEVAR